MKQDRIWLICEVKENKKKNKSIRDLHEEEGALLSSVVSGWRELPGKLASRRKNLYSERLEVVTNSLKLLWFSRRELNAATHTSSSSLSSG